jgi:hypothetical protein
LGPRGKGNSHVRLVRTLDREAKVLGLHGGELGQLDVDVVKVELGNLLVEDLGKHVDASVKSAGLAELDVLGAEGGVGALVQHDLGKDLVGEGARHDERRVAGGTAEVDETALGEEDDVAAVLEEEAVNLGLDVLDALGVGLEPGDINLDVEVANVCRWLVLSY